MHSVSISGTAIKPGKIVCVGRNYVAHIEELGNELPQDMVVFNKPNSAISDILRSQIADQQLHYEAELVFAIHGGKLSAVGFGLDLTKRELQTRLKNKGLPWERAKAFNGAAVFSDFVALPENIDALSVRLWVNDELRQHGGVDLMLYKPLTVLHEISAFMSLEDGDLIMTGTPAGVGEVSTGQRFTGEVLFNQSILVSATWVAQ